VTPAAGGRRIFLGAFGDPGHAFPMLALGRRLVERGHTVRLQTWVRWQPEVERAGMEFVPAPQYQVFPTRDRPLKPYQAAVRAARETRPQVREFAPDALLADILTVAPALAGDLEQVPVGSVVPHVMPLFEEGWPPYSIGARLPRTPLGRATWRGLDRVARRGLERGRDEYNGARARLGLPPRREIHTGLSRSLTLVGTLPQLEYPRRWPDWARVVGPLMWEPPGERVEPPAGQGPVVMVAPSTSQDPEHRLLRAALTGLADEPVRVIATWNGREPNPPVTVPDNAVLVPWLSYTASMPACDAVVLHGGHGTLVRALTLGCAAVVCPVAGDQNENAARVDWAKVGTRLPRRWLEPRTVRLAVRRVLSDPGVEHRTRTVADWAREHDGPTAASQEIERWIEDEIG
jgi:UDP:flavonoid glycosyltransferase YjiC (YdhE family)